MAEYDAFGNRIEEGAANAPSVSPGAVPEGVPTADVPSTAPPADPSPAPAGLKLSGRPSRFGGGVSAGPWVAVLVMVVVIGGGALVAYNAIDSANDTIRNLTPTLPKLPAPTVPAPESPSSPSTPKPARPVPPPVGLAPRSLIRHVAFAGAMAKLRNSHYGRLVYVRVAPDRIDAQLVSKAGRLRNVQIGTDGVVRQLGGPGSPGFHPPTIAFADIETGAPERLVRGGVRHGGVQAKGIDYLVVSRFADDVIWNAFFKNAVRYQGDRSGRVERRF